MRSLKSCQVGAARISPSDLPHRLDLPVLDAVHDQIHHRRLEEQPPFHDLDKARHVVMRADGGLVHAAQIAFSVVGEERAAPDLSMNEPLPLHHRERAADGGAAGVQPPGEVALVRKPRARHHVAFADALQERAIDERGRRPIVRGDGGQRVVVGGRLRRHESPG